MSVRYERLHFVVGFHLESSCSEGLFEKKQSEENPNEICETAHRLFPEGPPALVYSTFTILDGCYIPRLEFFLGNFADFA